MSNWKLAEVWNAATIARPERPYEPRDHMWASELGKGAADIILKMRGTEPTNPPNARSKRKFEAGNMFEWIVRLVLLRAGILKESQERCIYQYDGLLEVTGKLDFEAGGIPTYDKALQDVEALKMPEMLTRTSEAVIDYLRANYPDGVGNKLIEVKSLSSFMFEALERTGQASRNHRLQLKHYMKSKGYDEAVLLYVCRDDLRMMEIDIIDSPELEEEYRSEIEEITRIYRTGEMPPLESPIVYDMDSERFSKNWQVAYSSYLTMLYGYKDQAEFDEIFQPMAQKWNRVLNKHRRGLARLHWLAERGVKPEEVELEKVEGKRTKQQYIWPSVDGTEKTYLPKEFQSNYELTAKNADALAEIEERGFDFYALAERMKEPVEDEEEVSE